MNSRRVRHVWPISLVVAAVAVVIAACAGAPTPSATPATAPTPTPAAVTPAQPAPAAAPAAPMATAPATAQTEFVAPAPIKFEDAVTRAGRQLFRDAQAHL